MIFNRLKSKREEMEGRLDSYLGPGLRIEGSLEVKGDIRIDGEVKGDIFAEKDLFIGEKAGIKGDIVAENITIAGEVDGNVTANEKVELLSNAQLLGDIKASRVVIAEGVVFEGNCVVGNQGNREDKDSNLNLEFNDEPQKGNASAAQKKTDSSQFS